MGYGRKGVNRSLALTLLALLVLFAKEKKQR